MKRFRFTLHALLVLRRRQENQAMERYAAALDVRRKAQETVNRVEQDMAAAEMNIRDKMSGVSLASDIASLHGHYRTLENRRAEASRILASAEQAVRPALAQMIEGRRQREIVEGCEEKQRARFEKDCQREEVRMLDELALRRFTPASGARVNA